MSHTQAAAPAAPAELSPADRVLAEIKAHPSYEAVKAKWPGREPSLLELGEHAEQASFAGLTKAQKLARMLDPLIAEVQAQMKGGGPVTSSILSQLQAVRAVVS
jgi:hypothetical protein